MVTFYLLPICFKKNVSGDCALVNGLDFIQLTDVFTLTPNPASAYTQIKFGDKYIAEEKYIEITRDEYSEYLGDNAKLIDNKQLYWNLQYTKNKQ